MIDPILETLVLISGIGWFFYKFYKGKNLKHLCVPLMLISFLLSRWPLFLPTKISLAGAAFIAAGFLVYEQYFQSKVKRHSSLTYIYVILFFLFGIMLLIEAMLSSSSR